MSGNVNYLVTLFSVAVADYSSGHPRGKSPRGRLEHLVKTSEVVHLSLEHALINRHIVLQF